MLSKDDIEISSYRVYLKWGDFIEGCCFYLENFEQQYHLPRIHIQELWFSHCISEIYLNAHTFKKYILILCDFLDQFTFLFKLVWVFLSIVNVQIDSYRYWMYKLILNLVESLCVTMAFTKITFKINVLKIEQKIEPVRSLY